MNTKKEIYLRILDQFPNPIWKAGLDTKCDYFNKAWLDFSGRTLEQEMGNGWTEGVHKDDLNACVKIYLDAFEKRQSFQMEYRLMNKDGSYHWILDCGSPFFDDNDIFLGYVGSCYDIDVPKKYMLKIESMDRLMNDREQRIVTLEKQIAELRKEEK